MIAEPLVFTGRTTYEDLVEIHRFRVRASVRPSILVLMSVVSGSLLTLMIWSGTRTKLQPHMYFIIAFFVYWPWGWLLTREYAGRGRLRRAAAKATENTATFTNSTVSIASGEELSRLTWKRLKEIAVSREGLIFVLPRGVVWFYLPRRVMHEKDREEILATAAEHGVHIRLLHRDAAR